ncbi:Zein-binding domain-containing protein [Cephalotus follicularis]|uniref:Zein-binding domain-containing protein n=1 Tax=Cephalotus follicularis TaxID=3775 RepID=A0A1Q3C8Y0_CEPFO|nr:Zein-binding domain-containing protein [Cephalotus follicularis]
MAGNKFATMLHRNTHKITVILVYAVLEWILIILLLLNSLFTYFITKFAQYFGLKRPCLWCSRIDHVLESGNNTHSYRDVVCDTHATEISKLCYCTNHRELAEPQSMCMECFASQPNHNDNSNGITRRVAFISLVSRDQLENGEEVPRCCSCCNESLSSKPNPRHLLFKPSWGALDNCNEKEDLVVEAIDKENNGSDQYKKRSNSDSTIDGDEDDNEINQINEEEEEEKDHIVKAAAADEHQIIFHDEDCSRFSSTNLQTAENEESEDEKAGSLDTETSNCTNIAHQLADDDIIIQCSGEDYSLEIFELSLEKYITYYPDRLIPVELIDSSTSANQVELSNFKIEDLMKQDQQCEISDSALYNETEANVFREDALLMTDDESTKKVRELEILEVSKEDTEIPTVLDNKDEQQDLVGEACEQEVISSQATQTLSIDDNNIEAAMEELDEEEVNGFKSADQAQSTTSINTEASVHEANMSQSQKPVPSLPRLQEDQSSMIDNDAQLSNSPKLNITQNDIGHKPAGKNTRKEELILSDHNEEETNHNLSIRSVPHEAEEEKLPETPTSVESLHYLHKKLLLLDKREPVGTEDFLDGSVVSEIEGGDPVQTIEWLKTTVKAERKALNALYAELEEERSASAISTNQTMAMINRLQEEKAAMRMEALQYQRMMEEQSEYDQEALQLLNELMIKREKEKQELERELEIYRKKVFDYETKEKIRKMRSIKVNSDRSRNSSASYSNTDDSDELSIDLNRDATNENGSSYGNIENSNNITPDEAVQDLEDMALDCVKHISTLDESLAEFEEERLSILDQLKALEEKILTLGGNEFIEDESRDHSSEYNVKEFDDSCEFSSPEENGVSNGFSKDKHLTMSSMAKNLLPLLDAAGNETEEGLANDQIVESEYVEMQKSLDSKIEELDTKKKIAIEDEVEHVYERLQALEADKEFLKHCMISVKKGDKGVDLLQEILQHLRDLRTVELGERNTSDDPLE